MRKLHHALYGLAATIAVSSNAHAQQLNNKIPDFQSSVFNNCTSGPNMGEKTGVANPLLLLGSLLYYGKAVTIEGNIVTGLIREPLALPVITTDSGSPDQVTCSFTFESTAQGSLAFPGLAVSADRGDVYKGNVRLVARQTLATVPENGYNMAAWRSAKYRDLFKSMIGYADTDVNNFMIVDNIAIYVISVERYKRTNGDINGLFGVISGGMKYKRDETFSGTKVIVTGDLKTLKRSDYTSIQFASNDPAPAPPPAPTTEQPPPPTPQVLKEIPTGQLDAARESLNP